MSRLLFLMYLVPAVLLVAAQQMGALQGAVDLWAWMPLAVLFIALPAADHLIGQSRWPDGRRFRGADRWCDLILWLAVPAQTALVLWATWVFSRTDFSTVGMIGWVLSTGVASSIVGIAPGHELFHRRNFFERSLGGYLFSTVGYGGSKISHVRDHHVHVATAHDAATARRGQSLYAFLPRAWAVNFQHAFVLERERLKARGRPWFHVTNELLWWWAVTASFAAICFGAWGVRGLAFYAGQSVIAFTILEAINYIEHYGLLRRQRPDGSFEPVTSAHSWNCSYLLSNLLLLNLQRHSDHHESATKPYQMLVDHPSSPQLPAGYPTLLLLAFVPPLWHALADRLLDRLHAQQDAQWEGA